MILMINEHQIPFVESFNFDSGTNNTEVFVKFKPEHRFTYPQWLTICGILGAGNWHYKGVCMYNCPTYNDVNTPNSNWEGHLVKAIHEASEWDDRTNLLGIIDNDIKVTIYDEYDDDCCYERYWGEE